MRRRGLLPDRTPVVVHATHPRHSGEGSPLHSLLPGYAIGSRSAQEATEPSASTLWRRI